jgi:hypothetical protein
VRDVFDLITADNWITPSSPILLPVFSENEMEEHVLLLRSSDVRDVLDLSASDNEVTPSSPILFSGLSENEMKQ